jgi:hypothetical protein
MRCIWGSYFPLSESDKKAKQERVLAALEAGIVTEQTAIEEIATLYPTIGDPAQYLKALEEERQKKLTKMHDAQTALAQAGQAPKMNGSEDANGEQGSGVETDEKRVAPEQNKPAPKKLMFGKKTAKEKGMPVSIPTKGKARREITRKNRKSIEAIP